MIIQFHGDTFRNKNWREMLTFLVLTGSNVSAKLIQCSHVASAIY